MTDLAQALKAEPSDFTQALQGEMPPGAKKQVAPNKAFTMRALRRLTVWGALTAGALLIAALTGRNDVAVERLALVLHRPKPAAAAPFDAQAATQQLAEAVRGLKASDEQIKLRLATVEHDMDDVTGSITKQIKAAAASRRTEDGPSVAATAVASASTVAPVDIPPAVPSAPGTITTSANPAVLAQPPRTEFGVDIGSGLTIQALRMRWAAMRTAHPQLFKDLEPIVSVKDIPRTNRIELRLVAGPIAQPGTAAQLCAQLALLGLFCQPTIFDGQHLASR